MARGGDGGSRRHEDRRLYDDGVHDGHGRENENGGVHDGHGRANGGVHDGHDRANDLPAYLP